MRKNLPMKPPVDGKPARPSIEIVSGHASSGRARAEPGDDVDGVASGVSRSRMMITAKAARFIARYTAR